MGVCHRTGDDHAPFFFYGSFLLIGLQLLRPSYTQLDIYTLLFQVYK